MAFSKIDVHAHFIPDFYLEALREAGRLPDLKGMHGIPTWSHEEHLKFMEENNISKSYLSIASPGVFLNTQSPSSTTAAANLASRVNRYASALKSSYPSKFGFFASLPLPDIPASLAEVEHCYSTLNPRPDGFCILSNANGVYLGDPAMYPVYEALNRHGAVIFISPTTPSATANIRVPLQPAVSSSSKATTSGTDAGSDSAVHDLNVSPDFLFDITRTTADLLLTDTPLYFANLTWIVPHAGASLPSTLDRVVSFASVMRQKSSVDLVNPALPIPYINQSNHSSSNRQTPTLSTSRPRLLLQLHDSIYFDLTGVSVLNTKLPALLRWTEPSRLLYGSNVPFTSWADASKLAIDFDEACVSFWGGETGAEECAGVRKSNAEDLLG